MNILLLKRFMAAIMAVIFIGIVSPAFVFAAETNDAHKPTTIVEEHKPANTIKGTSKPKSNVESEKDNSKNSKSNVSLNSNVTSKDDKNNSKEAYEKNSSKKNENIKNSNSRAEKVENLENNQNDSTKVNKNEYSKSQNNNNDNAQSKSKVSRESKDNENSVAKGNYEISPAVSLVEDGHVVSKLPEIDLPKTAESGLSSEASLTAGVNNSQNKGSNQLFGIGLGLIILGVVGLGYVIYSQFFYTKHKNKLQMRNKLNENNLSKQLDNYLKTSNDLKKDSMNVNNDAEGLEEDIMKYSGYSLKTPIDMDKSRRKSDSFSGNDKDDTIEILRKHK